MPALFKNDIGNFSLTKIMANGVSFLYSEMVQVNLNGKFPKSLSLFLKSAGSGTISIKIAWHTGSDYTEYYTVKDSQAVEIFDVGKSLAFDLRALDYWLDTIWALRVLITRVSGSGDINFSNGRIDAIY